MDNPRWPTVEECRAHLEHLERSGRRDLADEERAGLAVAVVMFAADFVIADLEGRLEAEDARELEDLLEGLTGGRDGGALALLYAFLAHVRSREFLAGLRRCPNLRVVAYDLVGALARMEWNAAEVEAAEEDRWISVLVLRREVEEIRRLLDAAFGSQAARSEYVDQRWPEDEQHRGLRCSELAIGLVVRYPGISIDEIMKILRCGRQAVYKNPAFAAVRALVCSEMRRRSASRRPAERQTRGGGKAVFTEDPPLAD